MTKDQIFDKVNSLVTDYLRLNEGECRLESHITNDLGADSLALVELGFKFSETFGIGMMTPNEDNMIIGKLVTLIYNEINN